MFASGACSSDTDAPEAGSLDFCSPPSSGEATTACSWGLDLTFLLSQHAMCLVLGVVLRVTGVLGRCLGFLRDSRGHRFCHGLGRGGGFVFGRHPEKGAVCKGTLLELTPE